MDIERAINDDRAVSPVIGVILMVAITVILAAVIGTFVLGMSDQMGDTSPRASFTIGTAGNTATVEVVHESGATINADHVVIDSTETFTGASGGNGDTWKTLSSSSPDDVSAGSSVTLSASTDNFEGDTVRIIYDSPDSDSSTTLQKKTFN